MAKKVSPDVQATPSVGDAERVDTPEELNLVDLLSAVRSKYLESSRSRKSLMRVMLESPEAFVYASVADVAKSAGVSEAAVVRFGRTINCKGIVRENRLELESLLS